MSSKRILKAALVCAVLAAGCAGDPEVKIVPETQVVISTSGDDRITISDSDGMSPRARWAEETMGPSGRRSLLMRSPLKHGLGQPGGQLRECRNQHHRNDEQHEERRRGACDP